MCGDYSSSPRPFSFRVGSPPRVRGLHRNAGIARQRGGITPACAGTTRTRRSAPWCRWDHPRVCGDYLDPEHEAAIAEGSPPRVRGLLKNADYLLPGDRITPACAGTTSAGASCSFKSRDHPRVCGDYLNNLDDATVTLGSPPRVRGLRPASAGADGRRRITPACAGTTCTSRTRSGHPRDHPRVCGDYLFSSTFSHTIQGSPPRVRGLPGGRFCPGFVLGITPACAGTTQRENVIGTSA